MMSSRVFGGCCLVIAEEVSSIASSLDPLLTIRWVHAEFLDNVLIPHNVLPIARHLYLSLCLQPTVAG